MPSDKPGVPAAGDISRRTLLRSAALGTIALASGLDDVFAQTTASRPPNIVFLMADDLGFADLSCYGRRDFATPNIDQLAATAATRFPQGYANSAVCSATRTALITGRYQYRLALGLEEPLDEPGCRPAAANSRHCHRCSSARATEPRSSASGTLARCRAIGPLQSGTTTSTVSAAARVDYYSHAAGDHKEDLWDDDVQVHQAGYLTDLLGTVPSTSSTVREVSTAVLR